MANVLANSRPVYLIDADGNIIGTSNPLPVGSVGSGSGGKIKTVAITPVVTAGSVYGVNYCVGGKLTFPNLFGAGKSGIILSARIKTVAAGFQGWQLWMLGSDPVNSTIVDNAASVLAPADFAKVSGCIPLVSSSGLGSMGFHYADGIAQAHSIPGVDMYAILTTNQPLVTPFGTAADMTISLAVQPDTN